MNQNKILEFCVKNNFEYEKTIHKNDSKDTSVLLVSIDNKKFIVKRYGENSSKTVINAFDIEKKFYQQNKNEIYPEMIKSGKNYILLSYLNGISLREFLKNKNTFEKEEFEKIVIGINRSIKLFHQEFFYDENENNSKIILNALLDRLGNLATSGPRNTKRNWLESFIIRRSWKFKINKISKFLVKEIKNWKDEEIKMMCKNGHFDLHSDNFMVTQNEVKMIDFGNVRSPGIWISDILYCYGTIFALINTEIIKDKLKIDLFEFIKNIDPKFDKKSTKKLIDIFCFTADMNSRFRKDTKIDFSKILQFLKL